MVNVVVGLGGGFRGLQFDGEIRSTCVPFTIAVYADVEYCLGVGMARYATTLSSLVRLIVRLSGSL